MVKHHPSEWGRNVIVMCDRCQTGWFEHFRNCRYWPSSTKRSYARKTRRLRLPMEILVLIHLNMSGVNLCGQSPELNQLQHFWMWEKRRFISMNVHLTNLQTYIQSWGYNHVNMQQKSKGTTQPVQSIPHKIEAI